MLIASIKLFYVLQKVYFVLSFVLVFLSLLHFNSQTETVANRTTTLASGMMSIRMTVNGSVYTPELDVELPCQVCISSIK